MGDLAAVASFITPKQKRFVEEYLVDLNATQAAVRAGYSVRTANGSRQLRRPAASASRSRRTTCYVACTGRQRGWVTDRPNPHASQHGD